MAGRAVEMFCHVSFPKPWRMCEAGTPWRTSHDFETPDSVYTSPGMFPPVTTTHGARCSFQRTSACVKRASSSGDGVPLFSVVPKTTIACALDVV